jgi:uncharacterized membrane protein YccC
VAAIILVFFNHPAVILTVLVLATIATPTFVVLRYRYTAIAVSIMILLQMNLAVGGSVSMITERLVDTFIGAAVATLFSFVLASWEYQSLPKLMEQVLAANLRYMQASFDLLQGKERNDFPYRVQRKGLMDALATLSAALVRMLDEPASKRRAVADINLFIVQNYLLVAHVAALRAILRRHVADIPADQVIAMLATSRDQVCGALSAALAQPGLPASCTTVVEGVTDPAATHSSGAGGPASWPGFAVVQRRIRLLQADAEQIIVHRAAIERTVIAA